MTVTVTQAAATVGQASEDSSHPTPDDLAHVLDFFMVARPVLRHILDCPACLAAFTDALRAVSELRGPALWISHGLSSRAASALARGGILTWKDLRTRDLRLVVGIGKVGAAEIAEMIRRKDAEAGGLSDAKAAGHRGGHPD